MVVSGDGRADDPWVSPTLALFLEGALIYPPGGKLGGAGGERDISNNPRHRAFP